VLGCVGGGFVLGETQGHHMDEALVDLGKSEAE
jgi:hypothetical protein